jgi:hypothetical protein
VTTLAFSFQNILKIDNLQGFGALTKLQLDNNIIEKVENLSHLTNLTWLDLSFNNLTKIEGLETLKRLTVLTLFGNRITELEGMDSLRELEVFSVGNNAIASLDNIMYLRQFPRLRMVHLAGNPVSTPGAEGYSPEYKAYVQAHLKHLKFLDYRLVDPAHVSAAREQYADGLQALEEKEKLEEADQQEQAKVAEKRAKLAACSLSGIDTLLEDVLNEDPELPRLKLIDVLKDSLPELQSRFERLTEPFIENMVEAYQAKVAERDKFRGELEATLAKQEATSRQLLDKFEADKKLVMAMAKTGKDHDLLERKLIDLRSDIDQLYNALMELELCQVDINEGFLSTYEKLLKEAFDKASDHLVSYFVVLRDLEQSNHNNVMAAATLQHDKYIAGELETTLADEGRHILQDKDTLLNIVNGSHDAHIAKIDAREDELSKREADLYNRWIKEARDAENHRNRTRVSEVLGYCTRNRTEISDFLDPDAQ